MLTVEDLTVRYGDAPVVHELSFDIAPGESVGLVGESGSGKTQTALAILGLLPPGAAELKEDLQKNVRATLQTMFARMDLVTREEFEVQAAVLQRAREQLDALEKRVTALEEKARAGGGAKPQAKKKSTARKKTTRG